MGVTRCCKCQQNGHVQKLYTNEERTCAFCAKTGHMAEEYSHKKSNKPPTCPACRIVRMISSHARGDKNCLAFKALGRMIHRTNYGPQHFWRSQQFW